MAERREETRLLVAAGLIVVGIAAVAMLVTLRWGSDEPRFVGASFPSPEPPPAPEPEDAEPAQADPVNPPPEVVETPEEASASPQPEPSPSPPPAKPAVYGMVSPGAGPKPRKAALEPKPKPAAPKDEERGLDGVFTKKVARKLDDIWTKYAQKSAAINRFRTELHGKPDTKALIDQYHADGDLWAYLKGGISNSNWRKATVKAFGSPDAVKMLMEMVRATPADSLEKVGEQIQKSRAAESLLLDVSATSGMPMGSLLGGAGQSQEELLRAAMQSPEFKKAVEPDRRSRR